jgi:hypothetical protein
VTRAAVEWIAARIWWLIGCTVAAAMISLAVVVLLSRATARRVAEFAAQRAVYHREAHAVPAQPRHKLGAATVINLNFYGADAEATAACVIRTAIPGQAGEAVTKE